MAEENSGIDRDPSIESSESPQWEAIESKALILFPLAEDLIRLAASSPDKATALGWDFKTKHEVKNGMVEQFNTGKDNKLSISIYTYDEAERLKYLHIFGNLSDGTYISFAYDDEKHRSSIGTDMGKWRTALDFDKDKRAFENVGASFITDIDSDQLRVEIPNIPANGDQMLLPIDKTGTKVHTIIHYPELSRIYSDSLSSSVEGQLQEYLIDADKRRQTADNKYDIESMKDRGIDSLPENYAQIFAERIRTLPDSINLAEFLAITTDRIHARIEELRSELQKA